MNCDEKLELMKTVAPLWNELSFEPWAWRGLSGVKRRVTFRKGALLGEVARYYADDYIVWDQTGTDGAKIIIEKWQPADEVMSHRFLVLGAQSAPAPLKKYFLLGVRGWVEVLPYCLGDPAVSKFEDLIYITNKAWDYIERERGSGPAY